MFKALYSQNLVHILCLLLAIVSNGVGGVSMACCCQRAALSGAVGSQCCSANENTLAGNSNCGVGENSSHSCCETNHPATECSVAEVGCAQPEVAARATEKVNCCTGCERRSWLTSRLLLPHVRPPEQIAATFPDSLLASLSDSTVAAAGDRPVWVTHNRHQAQLGVWIN